MIVGDSVHDVACGRSLGVRAVAVATGITSLRAARGGEARRDARGLLGHRARRWGRFSDEAPARRRSRGRPRRGLRGPVDRARAAAVAPGREARRRLPTTLRPSRARGSPVTMDMRAAREILALFSARRVLVERRRRQLEDAAGRRARDPGFQPAARDVFERDLAAAFDEQTRTVRLRLPTDPRGARALGGAARAGFVGREADLTPLASDRARALIPPDRPISVTRADLPDVRPRGPRRSHRRCREPAARSGPS